MKTRDLGGFTSSGTYVITTPDTPTRWENKLFNDDYVLGITQRLEGVGGICENYNYTERIDFGRRFYLNLNGKCVRLFCGDVGAFRAEYDTNKMTVCEENDDFKITAEVTLPEKGRYELWRFTLESKSDSLYNLFCFYPFVNKGPMGGECRISEDKRYLARFAFPYHVKYDDKERAEKNHGYTYIIANDEIISYDGVATSFWGSDNQERLPAAVINGKCTNTRGQGEKLDGALHFSKKLSEGEKYTITLMVGVADTAEEIEALSNNVPDFDTAYKAAVNHTKEAYYPYTIKTPDETVNHMFNKWLPKQMIYLARHNRGGVYCPVRNQLQDALGYSMLDPYGAFELGMNVLRRQHTNGYLKQWYMTDNSPERDLCKINHSDACVWLVLCITEIINNCGDKSLFLQEEPYMDSDDKETILIHLKKAIKYMYSMRGSHGLCLMLDGDWTDPINGAGRKGKGESVWNSMALVYAIHNLTAIFPDSELDEIADKLTSAVNEHCWDGEWYIAGFDDDGKPFGTKKDREGRLFLNTQTWSLISKIATEERAECVKRSIDSLKVPFGWLLLDKPFFGWNETWGRISIKQPGTTENGSVYCHATMFKALGDCMTGDTAAAYDAVLRTLPTNPENPTKKNLQLPLFVPNYYFGIENENFGKSSCNYGTGTTAWLIWVMIKHILGIRITVDGISAKGTVPPLLKGTEVEYRFKGENHKFTV